MATEKYGDLLVTGKVTAGNIAQGAITIVPVANTVTSGTVTGLSLAGAGTVTAQTCADTIWPGTVVETAYSGASVTGMTVYLYRTDTTSTGIDWWMFVNRT